MSAYGLNTFPVYIGIGSIAGLFWSWWVVNSTNPHRYSSRKQESYLEFCLICGMACLGGALLGSRMSFVFMHWQYYSNRTAEILAIWQGGLDWSGAVGGAAILLLLVCGLYNQSPRLVVNDLLPFFTISIVSLWLACASSSIYYGPIYPAAWWTVNLVDQLGEVHSRVPIHLVAAIYTASIGLWLDLVAKKRIAAYRFEIFLAAQMVLVFVFSFWRADPVAPVAGMPSDRLCALLYLVIILAVTGWIAWWERHHLIVN